MEDYDSNSLYYNEGHDYTSRCSYNVVVLPKGTGSSDEPPFLEVDVIRHILDGGIQRHPESRSFRLSHVSSGVDDVIQWLNDIPSAATNAVLRMADELRTELPLTRKALAIITVNFIGQDEEYFYDEIEDEGGVRAVPAAKAVVEALEKVVIRVSDEVSCVVCMEEFLVGSEVARLPCSHVFHGDCIVKWLENRYVCPLCRFELPVDRD